MIVKASSSVTRTLRFGVFELDPKAGELCKKGMKIRLQGQPVDTPCPASQFHLIRLTLRFLLVETAQAAACIQSRLETSVHIYLAMRYLEFQCWIMV